MFGPYNVVEELYLSQTGAVARATRQGDEEGMYVVKRFSPPVDDPSEPHWDHALFLDRARAQQQLIAGGARHWAPIYQVGVSESGAWFATDYLPLSAQKLLDGRIEVDEAALYSIVSGCVSALTELRNARGRAHGNFKPSNVLVSGQDLATAHVLLTDLGSPAQAAKAGEPGDLHALGQLMHELLFHRRYSEEEGWPLIDAPEWQKLGANADAWRQLCSDLLVPVAALRPPLSAVARRIESLAPRRSHHRRRHFRASRKTLAVAALVPLALLFGAVLTLTVLDHSAHREFARSRQEWFGAFMSALSDPARRQRYLGDPTLRHVMGEVDVNRLESIGPSSSLLCWSPSDYRAVRDANDAVRRVQSDLTPEHWAQLASAVTLKEKFEDLAWPQPAEYLGKLIDSIRPAPGAQVAAAIDRLLTVLPRVEQQLPSAQESWSRLADRTREVQAKNDKALTAMAIYLRSTAAAEIELSDGGGLGGFDQVRQNARLAERLADALRNEFPSNIDRDRLARDVADSMDLDHLDQRDVEQYIRLVALNTIRKDETAAASAALKKRLNDTLALVMRSHPDAKETRELEQDKTGALASIADFGRSAFTARAMADGTFNARRTEVESRIDGLRKFYHADGPADWLKTLPVLSTSSQRINAYWEAWRRLLNESLDEMNRDRDVFVAYKQRADRLRELLTKIDHEFPAVPAGLSETFTQAARQRREETIEKLLPLIDPRSARVDPTVVKSTQERYAAWTVNLVALARDFPIRKEVLLLSDRPDKKWEAKGDFWHDAAIQSLVKGDVDRIDRLQALRTQSRPDLIKTAQSARDPEMILAAWQLLGSDNAVPGAAQATAVSPAWPTQPGDLTTELSLEQRLSSSLKGLHPSETDPILADERRQAPLRWRRYVQNATSEPMLEEAVKDQRAFGIDAAQLAQLTAPARYNLWTYVLHQGEARNNDELVQDAVTNLRKAAADLKDRPDANDVLARLTRMDLHEAFADLNPGDTVAVPILGVQPPVTFKRVEPRGARPFYLATTEVSFGNFVSVVQAANAWQPMRKLPWAYQPNQRDPRRGPRVWEWTDQLPVPMSTPQYWLSPDDDNDFALPLRAGRFNRMVLAERYGGPPEPDHPMQQISAQAALFYTAICGCRLPTSREWLTAYEQFEKSGPDERWNLRDQTYEQQRSYAAQVSTSHSLADGIFRPGASDAAGGASGGGSAAADANGSKALPFNDGTLYFRHVAAPGSGSIFQNLIGNVAEIVCDASERFDALDAKKSVDGIRKFVAQSPDSFFVIGGSALSPTDVPPTRPLPLSHTDEGYADVGLRLAFTAPARSLAERARWVLGDVKYIWPSAVVARNGS